MPLALTPQEIAAAIPSIQRFFRDELDEELSEMRARFLLDYVMQELGPLAYNRGVKDAENYFRARTEDLGGICFEPPLTYWTQKKKR